ncbi:MAG: phage tail protein [Planctomycetes bacterium]|nr:phage tail protein [Planctomycetota bacterium]
MARYIWKGVAVALGALGAAQAVSAVTKANPGVATYAGTDPANGDYFALTDVQGMIQLNNKIGRAANVNSAGNTLELEAENTSAYDTFVSGNLQPITFNISMQSGANVTVSGGDFRFVDFTTIHDDQEIQLPGLASALNFSFECFWDPADPALVALKEASDNQTQLAMRITFKGGAKYLLLGYVGATLTPTGQAQDAVKTSVTFTAFGRSKVFTS